MADEEQTTTASATEWTFRSDAEKRAFDALLRDPLWSLLDDETIASIAEVSPDVVRDHRRILRNVLGRIRAKAAKRRLRMDWMAIVPKPGSSKETVMSGDILAAPLSHLGLTIRAINALLNNGFRTVGDVVAMTEVDLTRLPRFGPATLADIKTKLSARGLALRAGGFGDSDWRPP